MDLSLDHILNLLGEKFAAWGRTAIKMLPNIALAVLVLIIGFKVSQLVERLAHSVFHRVSKNESIAELMGRLSRFLVIGIALFYALGIVELDKTVTSLLAGAGIIGIALGFAFQDIASNFISGFFIAVFKPFQVGDIVGTGDHLGRIRHIDLRTSIITTFDGLDAIIPNKDMFTSAVVNYTMTPERRVDLNVGVSYGSDLEQVEEITIKALEQHSTRLRNRPIEFFYSAFGESSIDFQVRVWIGSSQQMDYLAARHEVVKRIKAAFDENEIVIPFPIRTLDFGIKGGETLSQHLQVLNKSPESQQPTAQSSN